MTDRPVAPVSQRQQWFIDHYETAPREIVSFLAEDGLSLAGKSVADIGCGDGVMSLGLLRESQAARVVGYDINPVDRGHLQNVLRANQASDDLPPGLAFAQSGPWEIPAETHEFDYVATWSAFEHVSQPVRLMKEMRRIIKPHGCLFLQLFPFYHSAHGGHQWGYHGDFEHLMRHEDELVAEMRAQPGDDPEFTEYMTGEIRHLNRLTVDELQRCLLSAGFHVTKFQLIAPTTRLPIELQRYPLTQLGVGGIKLLAVIA